MPDDERAAVDGRQQFLTHLRRPHGRLRRRAEVPAAGASSIFLLRELSRAPGSERRSTWSLATLREMAQGGMHDQLGGGFHRYSVDGDWLVPHFEKMLYDQAQLVIAYLEASQAGGDPFFADVARDTLQYVLRDMTDEGGGFYSAEDADSVPPDQSRRSARAQDGRRLLRVGHRGSARGPRRR